jgi:3',5'-cyclic AMP phosphodiesterase CpdA
LTEAGIDAHFTLGNHDHRRRFWEALPGERASPADGDDLVSEADEKHSALVAGRDVDWVLLDSLQETDVTPGRVGERQLAWLANQLASGDKPVVVLAHHHPTTTPVGGGLMDTVALFDILNAHPRVKAFVFGHTHRWKVAERDGIHLVNLPPVAYPFSPGDPCGWVRAEVASDGMELELCALDKQHARHGERVRLTWRAG